MKPYFIKFSAVILTLVLCLCLASCSLSGSGEEETTEPVSESMTPVPTDAQSAIEYFNTLMTKLSTEKYAVKYSVDYRPRGFECEGNKTLAATLPTVVKLMSFGEDLGGEFEYGDLSFAEKVLPVKNSPEPLQLTLDDIAHDEEGDLLISVNPDQFAALKEEESKAAENEEYTMEDVNTDPDTRIVTITLRDEKNPADGGFFSKIYDLPDRQNILNEFAKCSDYLKIADEYDADYTGCTIRMEIDRLTDRVVKLEFGRNIIVTATVTGAGTLESVGEQVITFTVNGNDTYEFDWNKPEN